MEQQGMDVECVTDFKALRAKFQNDSDLANKLVQPLKKPSTEITSKLGSGGNAVSNPLPLSKRDVKIIKPAHPTSQPSMLTQHSPLPLPQAKLGHNKEQEGNISGKRLSSPQNSSEKPLLSCSSDQQGSGQTAPVDPQPPNSFHHVLQIWEETLSCNEKASATLPMQRAANLDMYPCPEQRATRAPVAWDSDRMRPSGSKAVLDWRAQKKNALRGSGTALPQAPRGHRSSDGAGAEGMVATAFCQAGYRPPGEKPQHQKELEPPLCQPRAGKWSYSPRNKWPRIKPLPSAESLGPAPGKPPRPPKFDLNAFRSNLPLVHRGNETTAGEEDYLSPKSAQLQEQNNYEETPVYLNQAGDTTTLCVIEGTLQVPKAEPQEHKKQKIFPFAKSSPERATIEDEKEGKPSHEREKLEVMKIFKTGGSEYMSPSSQTKEDGRDGMKVLQGRQDVTSTLPANYPILQGLSKDRAELLHSMDVGAPKLGAERTALNQNTWQPLQAPEDIYDDIEELQDGLSYRSDASSSFTSDSFSGNTYEETYEDVEIGGDNPAKPETEKQKRFGNLFKIEKLKLNNFRLKENLRNIFKFKKSSEEKSRKREKEEKFFRETFMYDKEINVINTATAECSVPSERRVDLPVTAGEQLDVIDVTEGHAVICRNSEGRYGYVLVEHLNFGQTVLTSLRAALPWTIPESLLCASCIHESARWSAVE
ncbi:FYN-binding protein 2 isoform X1 [Empidonax traillii]|uniref:FYN-binding protein 2 isoform X1 n=1 Tax=Empidonax traillii TaxID=164674 RepID=UPI000FFD097B|nr:FYN-binding protein 2 isoform X1 [Empidonax traillii]XP_027734865.1 FYN-binding protein 2 isoform X1 [Empidonax traillii]